MNINDVWKDSVIYLTDLAVRHSLHKQGSHLSCPSSFWCTLYKLVGLFGIVIIITEALFIHSWWNLQTPVFNSHLPDRFTVIKNKISWYFNYFFWSLVMLICICILKFMLIPHINLGIPFLPIHSVTSKVSTNSGNERFLLATNHFQTWRMTSFEDCMVKDKDFMRTKFQI